MDERKISRVNVTMSDDLKEWYQEEAYSLGLSMSSLMMITLKRVKDDREAITNSLQMMDFAEKNKEKIK